ncbi:MAG: OsmC family protein [Thermomicrobiales bacterium]
MAKKSDKSSKKSDKQDKKRSRDKDKDKDKARKLKGTEKAGKEKKTKPTEVIRPSLREIQSSLKQVYRDDPESALITSAVFSATKAGSDNPTRVRIAVDGPSGAVFEIGAHVGVGGMEDLPCSGDIFLASLAACQEVTIRMVAAAMGIALKRLYLRVEGDWDVRGTLAVSREAPVGFTAIRILVDLDVEAPPDKIERLLASAEWYCVVSATLRESPSIEVIVSVVDELGALFVEEMESE